ncbi:PREDICTED: zinc finger BED domain-containing protein RICESLEEPER 2-like [Brassica oleracea var. oleracea]|uniref:zinc finger BED domain-containing protein RICESLEEPER 2-like n=1 Tax=Brassica oleracea var. oleracea TaxID=109376 RepID=UPI0006A6EBBD|nr:PREDICTED: zinc finger BED domain-containing protein RICESLEEPER 2-like [Brassica oleracea var. oleracea]
MGSRDDLEEQFTLNTDYLPPGTCDLGTQQLIARLAAEHEIGDLRANGANDGKKQARKRKLISLVDSEEESDVEITLPTRSSKPRRQTTFGTSTRKPMLQSTLDAGSGSSARACRQKNVPLKASQKKKKKNKIQEDIPEFDDDLEEVELGEAEIDLQEIENRQRSGVWTDFKVVEKPSGDLKAVCNHFKNEYAVVFSLAWNKWVEELAAKTIVQHDLPYSYVEYERVRETWKYLNVDVQFICRDTAKSDVYQLYESERDTLNRELASLPGRVSFTSDLWTSLKREGYMCVTGHYIDRNWKLNNKILSFSALPPPHNGMSVTLHLLDSLKEWGLKKKVFAITLDNATSNDSMQDIVKSQLLLSDDLLCGEEFFYVRCAAHILNLIVQDCLKVIGGTLYKVRESIKYVLASETREELFEKCVNAVGITENAGLILDVQTRWNSTYYMLERAIKYRKEFVKLETFDKRGYKVAPTTEEWMFAEKICQFLCPFAEITKLMSGSNYPTSNLYFYQVWSIHEWLQINEYNHDEILRKMMPPMKEKFDKYLDEVSCVFAMAAVFDPCFKLSIVECCLGKLDISTRDVKLKNLRQKLSILFESYDKKSKANSPSTEPRETVPQNVSSAGSMGLCWELPINGAATGKTALEAYLDEPPLDIDSLESLDILQFWKTNTHRYGDLAAMACDLLSIPITTVASESFFSIGSRVLNKCRSRLLQKNMQALICTRNWIKGYEAYEHEDELDPEEETLPSFDSIANAENDDEEV